VSPRTIRYRGYMLAVHAPASAGDLWRVLMWPPSKDAPTIMPPHASEDEAVKAARAAVDQILPGPSRPTP
jgi:hypothetical protein